MIVIACAALCATIVFGAVGPGEQAREPPPQPAAQAPAATVAPAAAPAEIIDVFDLIRKVRHKERTPEEQAAADDPTRRMYAFAPVIGYKPSSGGIAGVAGNLAFFGGDPGTTHISSVVGSLTVSALKQTSASARFGVFTHDDRWKLEGDNRLQWTSQDTFGLGTRTTAADKVNQKYDYFRVYETVYRAVRPGVFAGLGFHYSAHTNVRPGKDAEAGWSDSAYVVYSQQHGFALDSQTSAGASVNLLVDRRDSAINADRGWTASVNYRAFFSGFLGGDSTWQQLGFDARKYTKLSAHGRHKLALWLFGDFVAAGVAPYLDLPATGMDSYGRSARGYGEGRFRGERLLYGEVEFRGTLTRNGLLGVVVFVNSSTFTNLQSGERLFHGYASAAGAGLRLLVNKRSKTNLCVDVGWGKQGAHGVYLAIQEAF